MAFLLKAIKQAEGAPSSPPTTSETIFVLIAHRFQSPFDCKCEVNCKEMYKRGKN